MGCKVNQFESESIQASLTNSGWEPAIIEESCDIIIINTCTVTQKAAMQSRQAIRQAIRNNPNARVIVTGCYAQTAPEDIQQIKGVHEIIGHSFKHKIAEALLAHPNKAPTQTALTMVRKIDREQIFKQTHSIAISDRTRPFLKIQDGCDACCTYCIVPSARGQSRSMPMEDILLKIAELKSLGYKEIVLTGINLGNYGRDLSEKNGCLKELLFTIESQRLIDRVRLSSVEPMEFDKDLIELIAGSKTICHHFHIPLQSGDDEILKKMQRPYSREKYRQLIETLHRIVPDAAIGTDVLIGFPGESDEAFENTFSLVESLPLAYLHVFPYSLRPGTPAALFPGRLGADAIKERCRSIRELGNRKRQSFYKNAIGQKMEVLIEHQREPASNHLKGITSNYIPVLLNGPDELKNSFQIVRVNSMNANGTVSGTILIN